MIPTRPALPRHRALLIVVALAGLSRGAAAQVDPEVRNQLELGYDQALIGRGPHAIYAYYYLNDPEFTRTNLTLRLAVAPLYLDSELAFRGVITDHTDLGLGIAGGGFSDNYYEIREGNYYREESFYGSGGGASLGLYHLLNPGWRIPLHVVGRAGARYTTYEDTSETADDFTLPPDRVTTYVRTGLRLGGNEPVLYPDLGLELSFWFERQWRSHADPYGYNGDYDVSAAVSLYWLRASLNYAWTNTGHRASFALTAGDSDGADRFSTWRLGGVLPLVSEFPLILPGYYYQELSAERFVHLYGSYSAPLDGKDRWHLRLEAAGAWVNDLPGVDQGSVWNSGVGAGITYTSRNRVLKVAIRYGYGFQAIRHGEEGGQSIGLLLQYDFEALKRARAARQ